MRFQVVFAGIVIGLAFLAFASGVALQTKGAFAIDDACFQEGCALRDQQARAFTQAGQMAMWLSLPMLAAATLVASVARRSAPETMPQKPWQGD